MSIHSEHPFLPDESGRDPVRRLRGRLPAPVCVLTTGHGRARVGWTISSLLVAEGDPAEVILLLDADSDLADALGEPREAGRPPRAVLNVLGPGDAALADVFAGLAPSPGGPFRTGVWDDSDAGPVLTTAAARASLTVDATSLDGPRAGWSLLLRARVDDVALADTHGAGLAHVRGRIVDLAPLLPA